MAAKPTRGARNGMDGLNGRDGRDSRPMPDPTVPTQVLVDQAVDAVKETFDSRLTGQREVLETRLNGIEQATKLLQTILDRLPAEMDVKINHLKLLHSERLGGIETRILERDDQKKEAKADAKVGIDAALASAEKLVGQSNDSFKELFEKAERSTEKLLDKQDENQKNSAGALEDKISALKERVDRFEGIAAGVITSKADTVTTQISERGGNSFVLSMVMGAVGIISLFITIFVVMRGG